jgi:hypothetical protein
MLQLFKKKRKLDPMEDLLNFAIEDFGEKWISYTKSTRFKISVPLSENIDNFAQPLVEFYKNQYMTLYQFNRSIFWNTVTKAILGSKTHPQDEVVFAIKELDTKYG